MEQYANRATTTLAAGINASVTSLVVASATGFPASGDFRLRIDSELLLVTGVSGTTFTVTRGVEGSTVATHAIGASVKLVLTKASLQNVLIPGAGGPWTDVRAYGATGDGTTNDYPAIQACLDDVGNGNGGIVFFSPGVYKLSEEVYPWSNTMIIGAGTQATFIRSPNLERPVIALYEAANAVVRDLTVGHTGVSERGVLSGHGIEITSSTNFLIDNVEVDTVPVCGMLFSIGNTYGVVRNCYIHDSYADGILMTGESSDIVFQGNRITDTGDDGIAVCTYQVAVSQNERISVTGNVIHNSSAHGVTVAGSKDVTVVGNTISDTRFASIGLADNVGAGATHALSGIVIASNTLRNGGTYAGGVLAETVDCGGVRLAVGTANNLCRNIVISGNIIHTPRCNFMLLTHTVSAETDLEGVTISNNICYGPTSTGSDDPLSLGGIILQGTKNARITDNAIFKSQEHGILVFNTCSGDFIVQGNYLEECNQSGTAANGGIDINVGRASVIGNVIYDPGSKLTNAIDLTGVTSFQVGANVLGGRALVVPATTGVPAAFAGGVATKVKAGTPSDADFVNPVDGIVVGDSTGSKIWIRVGGAWKSVAVA